MRRIESTSEVYLRKLVESVEIIKNMHIVASKALKETVGYFGSDRDPHTVSFEVIGGDKDYYNTDIPERTILGSDFIKYTSDIGFCTRCVTIILRVCVLDEDMNTLPLWADDEDYAYIILPYTPKIHKFFKNFSKINFNPYRYKTDKDLSFWANWESLPKFMETSRDDFVDNKYSLFYNEHFANIFGKNVWNYFKLSNKFATAKALLHMERFKEIPYEKFSKNLYGINNLGICVNISDESDSEV